MEHKPSFGKLYYNSLLKKYDTVPVIEQGEAHTKEYIDNVILAIKNGRKEFPNTDLFIEVLSKKERLMQTVIRNYFAYRLSCPTPNYDQSVFHYHHKDELLEHVWTIPDRQTCFTYLAHVPEIDTFEWSLLQNVLKFNDGTLFKLCQKLNNEGDL